MLLIMTSVWTEIYHLTYPLMHIEIVTQIKSSEFKVKELDEEGQCVWVNGSVINPVQPADQPQQILHIPILTQDAGGCNFYTAGFTGVFMVKTSRLCLEFFL